METFCIENWKKYLLISTANQYNENHKIHFENIWYNCMSIFVFLFYQINGSLYGRFTGMWMFRKKVHIPVFCNYWSHLRLYSTSTCCLEFIAHCGISLNGCNEHPNTKYVRKLIWYLGSKNFEFVGEIFESLTFYWVYKKIGEKVKGYL